MPVRCFLSTSCPVLCESARDLPRILTEEIIAMFASFLAISYSASDPLRDNGDAWYCVLRYLYWHGALL